MQKGGCCHCKKEAGLASGLSSNTQNRLFFFLKAGYLRVALAIMEFTQGDQAGLQLTEICLPLPAGIKGMHSHCWAFKALLITWLLRVQLQIPSRGQAMI